MPDLVQPYPKAVKRFPTLRQSLLSNYDDCALMARFEIAYRKGWDTHPQGRGQLTHRTLAKCLEEMHTQGESRIEVDVALAILHEVLRQGDVDDTCHEPGCELPARFLPPSRRTKNGRSLICGAGHRHTSSVVNVPMREIEDLYWIVKKWAFDNTFDVSHLVDVEQRLNVRILYPHPEGGSVERILTGQLDAWFLDPADDSHAITLDWKDTWGLPPETEISFEGYFQQRFYALLLMRNHPSIRKVTLREFYVRFSQTREVTIERDRIDDIETEFAALAERFDRALQTNNWKPTPGRHCNFCPRPAACPIPVFARGEGRILDSEHAQKVAAQLIVAEAVVKQARNSLRSYCKANGPVPVKDAKGNTFFGFEETETVLRPDRDEVADAVRLGRDPRTLFRVRKGTKFGQITMRPKDATAEDDEMLALMRRSVNEAAAKV